MQATVEGEYETIYDNMSRSFQDTIARGLDIEILDCRNTLQGYRNKLKVSDNETERNALADSILKQEEKLDELQALNKDVRKYCVWSMRNDPKVAKDRSDIIEGRVSVLGETVEGDNGTLRMKFPHGQTLYVFVKENGEWKWDGVASTRAGTRAQQ